MVAQGYLEVFNSGRDEAILFSMSLYRAVLVSSCGLLSGVSSRNLYCHHRRPRCLVLNRRLVNKAHGKAVKSYGEPEANHEPLDTSLNPLRVQSQRCHRLFLRRDHIRIRSDKDTVRELLGPQSTLQVRPVLMTFSATDRKLHVCPY